MHLVGFVIRICCTFSWTSHYISMLVRVKSILNFRFVVQFLFLFTENNYFSYPQTWHVPRPSHPCLAFWQLGGSQTMCKKVGMCVCLIWIYSLETWSPATTGHGHATSIFSQCWNFFYLGMWSFALDCVFSKSLSYTVSLFRQFRCRLETVSLTVLK